MATIMPQNELVRRAAAWISNELGAKPERPVGRLLDEAGMRFTLSPIDQRMLAELFSRDDCPANPPTSGRPL